MSLGGLPAAGRREPLSAIERTPSSAGCALQKQGTQHPALIEGEDEEDEADYQLPGLEEALSTLPKTDLFRVRPMTSPVGKWISMPKRAPAQQLAESRSPSKRPPPHDPWEVRQSGELPMSLAIEGSAISLASAATSSGSKSSLAMQRAAKPDKAEIVWKYMRSSSLKVVTTDDGDDPEEDLPFAFKPFLSTEDWETSLQGRVDRQASPSLACCCCSPPPPPPFVSRPFASPLNGGPA